MKDEDAKQTMRQLIKISLHEMFKLNLIEIEI